MELQTIGRPRNPGNPLLDMFARIIQEVQNLPVPVETGKPLAPRAHQDIASLNLSDSRSIVVDGRPAQLPLGTGKKCTGAAIKAMAGVYRGRILSSRKGSTGGGSTTMRSWSSQISRATELRRRRCSGRRPD
jgi:hypothetical protein